MVVAPMGDGKEEDGGEVNVQRDKTMGLDKSTVKPVFNFGTT